MAKDKITYYIQKLDGKKPVPELKTLDLDMFWQNAPAGRYTVELKRIPKEKSYQQVKTVFGLMIAQTIAQANDEGIDVSGLLKYLLVDRIPKGQGLTPDFLLELAYIICPTNDEEGRRITLSKMSTLQAANFFERFRTIIAGIGIVIPDPNPEWWKDQKEKLRKAKKETSNVK
jgi:hypothetical protein